MELVINGAASGYCPRPFTLLGHRASSPAGGMRSIQPGWVRPREVGVCLVAPCDSGACTTLTDTMGRPRGESRVNSSHSRSAPCQRPTGSVHPSDANHSSTESFSYFASGSPTCISGWAGPSLRHLRHPALVSTSPAINTRQFALGLSKDMDPKPPGSLDVHEGRLRWRGDPRDLLSPQHSLGSPRGRQHHNVLLPLHCRSQSTFLKVTHA